MNRTITVKGTGSASAKPDYVFISLSISAEDKDYEKCMNLASEQLNGLKAAAESAGFEKDALKTTNFNIRTDYHNVKDKNGNYRSVFEGYVCEQSLKLSFDFTTARLGEALSALAKTNHAVPDLGIRFTVKNPAAISEELLRSAAENARKKAEILCSASDVKLGQLVAIDYNWGELNVYSDTEYCAEEKLMPIMALGSFNAEIEPDDIALKDTATFVWELD